MNAGAATAARPVRVGVIGLGFMGATHVRSYRAAAAEGLCTLAAVADRHAERLTGLAGGTGNLGAGAGAERLFDPREVRTYPEPEALLADPGVDLVSVCTHTDTHVALATAALEAGKHVLVEKPVALASRDVRTLADAARRSGRLCMPAMCMRFWPGWAWLKERIAAGDLGPVRSATFQRLGSPPDWATGFYADVARSGGALVDLHIHDADFVRWCFGPPSEVVSAGGPAHVTTIYRYPGGPGHVVAEGGQDAAPGFGFRMRYVVAFERATADFDLSRAPPLLLHRGGRSEAVPLPAQSGYEAQVRHLLEAVRAGRTDDALAATIDEAVKVAELLEAERESAVTGRPIPIV